MQRGKFSEEAEKQKIYFQYLAPLRGRIIPVPELGTLMGFICEVQEEQDDKKEVIGTHIYFSEDNGWKLNPINKNHPEMAMARGINSEELTHYSTLNHFGENANIFILKPSSISEIIVFEHRFKNLSELISSLSSIEMLRDHGESLEQLKNTLSTKYFR
jgi:hypothetical protein